MMKLQKFLLMLVFLFLFCVTKFQIIQFHFFENYQEIDSYELLFSDTQSYSLSMHQYSRGEITKDFDVFSIHIESEMWTDLNSIDIDNSTASFSFVDEINTLYSTKFDIGDFTNSNEGYYEYVLYGLPYDGFYAIFLSGELKLQDGSSFDVSQIGKPEPGIYYFDSSNHISQIPRVSYRFEFPSDLNATEFDIIAEVSFSRINFPLDRINVGTTIDEVQIIFRKTNETTIKNVYNDLTPNFDFSSSQETIKYSQKIDLTLLPINDWTIKDVNKSIFNHEICFKTSMEVLDLNNQEINQQEVVFSNLNIDNSLDGFGILLIVIASIIALVLLVFGGKKIYKKMKQD